MSEYDRQISFKVLKLGWKRRSYAVHCCHCKIFLLLWIPKTRNKLRTVKEKEKPKPKMYSVLPANTVTALLWNLSQANNKSLNTQVRMQRSRCQEVSRPAGRLQLLPLLTGAQLKSCWPRGVGQTLPMRRRSPCRARCSRGRGREWEIATAGDRHAAKSEASSGCSQDIISFWWHLPPRCWDGL